VATSANTTKPTDIKYSTSCATASIPKGSLARVNPTQPNVTVLLTAARAVNAIHAGRRWCRLGPAALKHEQASEAGLVGACPASLRS
jgi:hypothetical protein